jgi:hypothetical protein
MDLGGVENDFALFTKLLLPGKTSMRGIWMFCFANPTAVLPTFVLDQHISIGSQPCKEILLNRLSTNVVKVVKSTNFDLTR